MRVTPGCAWRTTLSRAVPLLLLRPCPPPWRLRPLAPPLEQAARELDMRASPYDLSAAGLAGFDPTPIRIETAEGRRDYQRRQLLIARRAAPLRRRLLGHYDSVIASWKQPGGVSGEELTDAATAELNSTSHVLSREGVMLGQ